MRKISSWAKSHPWCARLCIILLYIPLNLTGLVTGDLLFSLGIRLPGSFLVGAMAIFAVTAYCYPGRQMRTAAARKDLYFRRKACDLLLVCSTFLMVCFTGNQANLATPFYPLATPIAGTTPAQPHASVQPPGTKPAFGGPLSKKLNKKMIRKTLRHYIKEYRKLYEDHTNGEKVILIALTIIGALLLFFLIVGLSCNIACGGAEALAYIVFFGGTFAIVFFTVRLIQRISRGRPRNQREAANPVGSRLR